MSAARAVLAFVTVAAACYAGLGLLTSLRDFGIGAAVAAAAVLLHGLLDYCDERRREHDHRIRVERQQVWARREGW